MKPKFSEHKTPKSAKRGFLNNILTHGLISSIDIMFYPKISNDQICYFLRSYVNARQTKTANISGKQLVEFSPELYRQFVNDRCKTAKGYWII